MELEDRAADAKLTFDMGATSLADGAFQAEGDVRLPTRMIM
jgi:hypothetical protein